MSISSYVDTTAILYSRYYKGGKVFRVARVDPCEGICLALYPTKKRGIFSTEACEHVEDHSKKEKIPRGEIQDRIWLDLLDGKTHAEITRKYERCGSNTFYTCKRGTPHERAWRCRTFRITEDRNEEDILAEDGTKEAVRSQSS